MTSSHKPRVQTVNRGWSSQSWGEVDTSEYFLSAVLSTALKTLS